MRMDTQLRWTALEVSTANVVFRDVMGMSYDERRQRAWMEQRHCLGGTVFEVSVFFNSRTAS